MIPHFIIGGLTLGLFSSLHCVGMCGPLVMALPVNHLSAASRALSVFIYHAGRILTYLSIGVLFASLGRGIYIAGLQQYFSIALGGLMLFMAAYSFISKTAPRPRFIQTLHRRVYNLMAFALNSRGYSGFFLLGLFNGLLPCGMVYLAVAGALASTQVWQGALFMGSFGLGTLPALSLLSHFSYRVSMPLRNILKKGMPALVILMGILLILRGMNLGIPYLSPLLPAAPQEAVICR